MSWEDVDPREWFRDAYGLEPVGDAFWDSHPPEDVPAAPDPQALEGEA